MVDESTVMSEALGVVGAWGVVVIEGSCVCCVCGSEGVVLVDRCFCVRAAMMFSCVAASALSNKCWKRLGRLVLFMIDGRFVISLERYNN